MFLLRNLSLGLILIIFSLMAFSNSYGNEESKLYLNVTKVDEGVLSYDEFYEELTFSSDKSLDVVTPVLKVIDGIVATGQRIWKLIEAGRIVSQEDYFSPINVVPSNNGEKIPWDHLELWSLPKFEEYEATYSNGLGNVVGTFRYKVFFQYGGSYNGKGKYLAGVNVKASMVDLSWGHRFDAESVFVTASNRGTKEDPIAAVTLDISYTMSNLFGSHKKVDTFHVTGDGEIVKL